MYRLVEYYWTGSFGKATGRAMRFPTTFLTVEAARTAADLAYKEARQIPESENIVLLVHDEKDRIVYSVPEKPFGK